MIFGEYFFISRSLSYFGEPTINLEENFPWKTTMFELYLFFSLDSSSYKVNDNFFKFSGFKILTHSPFELPNSARETIAHFNETTVIFINPKIYDIDERLKSLHYEK